MAEFKNDEEEHALPTKRKPDICSVHKDNDKDEGEDLKKKQKLETSSDLNSLLTEDKIIDQDNDDDDDDEEEDYDDEDEDEDDEDDEDEDDENSDGKAQIDRKGKGILREDKGKGKLIEETDDSSDGGSESDGDGDSDLSDDPLAEVDLDNILPSRTRRRAVQPGVRLSNDAHNNNGNDDA